MMESAVELVDYNSLNISTLQNTESRVFRTVQKQRVAGLQNPVSSVHLFYSCNL